MSLQQLRNYLRTVEQGTERLQKSLEERAVEGFAAKFPSVILVIPGMLVSGRMVSSRSYNHAERKRIEEAQQTREEAFDALEEGANSMAGPLTRLFPEPTLDDTEAVLQDDYEPQTIYLLDVYVVMGGHITELSGIAIEFDRVIGWELGALSA